MSVIHTLRKMPSACWMTYGEVLAYIEQDIPSLAYHSLGGFLNKAAKAGFIERKPIDGRLYGHGGRHYLYRGQG